MIGEDMTNVKIPFLKTISGYACKPKQHFKALIYHLKP
jgi:hypothetical protein